METADVPRAVTAAAAIAESFGLRVDDVRVLHDSNKLSLHLMPCDVFARVAHAGREVADLEVEIARRLADTESPVAELDPRVPEHPHEHDGFVVTMWTYHAPVADRHEPGAYAAALAGLHAGMRQLDTVTPRFTTRVEEARHVVATVELSPGLGADDRTLLSETLHRLTRSIGDRHRDEQLLHGEPHPGNVISTGNGLRFVDLETCCRGPVEFDLAHVPEAVASRYPDLDEVLLRDCRELVLAMVAAWRFERGDQLPNGQRAAQQLLAALRGGPPWPTLDALMGR